MSEDDAIIQGLSNDPMKLAQRTRDPQAASLIAALGQYEDEFNTRMGKDGWDWPLLLVMIHRSLPPKEVADELMQVLGGQAVMIGFKFFNLTEIEVNVEPNGIELHQFLPLFAEMLRNDATAGREAMLADLAQGGTDVLGWGLHIEGYGVSLKPGQERPEGKFKDLPGHYEQRIIMAVDRAGYRYSVTRTRGTEEITAAIDMETNKGSDARLGGRVLEGLMEIMRATPDET